MRLLVLALLILPYPAFAKVELRNVQASHGPLGPERTSLDVFPFDEVFFRFDVAGVKTDADGKTDGELTIQLQDAAGKTVFQQKGALQRQLQLGGDSFVSHAFITIGPKAQPGEYTLSVTFRDRLAGESASFEKKLKCLPVSFQILVPRFYRDSDLKVPAPVGGQVGETLYFKLKAIGFDRSQKKVQTTMTAVVLDKSGKEVGAKPIVVQANLTNPDEAEKATQATYNGAITLNRTGEYRLRITVEDLIGKQKVTFEAPLRVTNP